MSDLIVTNNFIILKGRIFKNKVSNDFRPCIKCSLSGVNSVGSNLSCTIEVRERVANICSIRSLDNKINNKAFNMYDRLTRKLIINGEIRFLGKINPLPVSYLSEVKMSIFISEFVLKNAQELERFDYIY